MNGAAEALLQDLLAQATTQTQLLQKLARGYTGGSGGGGAGGAAGAAGAAASFNPLSFAFNAVSGALKMFWGILKTVGGVFNTLVSVVGNVSNQLAQLGKQALEAGIKLSDFYNLFSNVPILGPLFSLRATLQQVNEAMLELYRNTATVGATFGGSLSTARALAGEAGLSFQEFGKVIRSNANELRQFGGTVESGATRLAKMNMAFMTGTDSAGRSVLGLGVKFDEAADYLASYMGRLATTGDQRNKSDQQVISGAREYVMNLDMLARLTGQEREALDKKLRQQQEDEAFNAYVASIEDEATRKNILAMRDFVAATEPTALQQFQAGIRGLSMPMGEYGEMLVLTGQGAELASDNFMSIAKNAKTADEAQRMIGEMLVRQGSRFREFTQGNTAQLAFLLEAFKGAGQGSMKLARQNADGADYMKNWNKALSESTNTAKGNADAAARQELGARGLGQMLLAVAERIGKGFMGALDKVQNWIMDAGLPLFEKVGEWLGKFVTWLVDTINEYIGIFKKGGLTALIPKIIEDIKNGLSKAWEYIKDPTMRFYEGTMKPFLENLGVRLFAKIDEYLNKVLPGFLGGGKDANWITANQKQAEADMAANRAAGKRAALALLPEEGKRNEEQQKIAEEYMREIKAEEEQIRKLYKEMAATGYSLEASSAVGMYISSRNLAKDWQRHSGTIGMTGSWWEKESGPKDIQAGESVLTQSQLAQIVDTAGQSGLAAQVERLNSLTAEMLHYLKETAENTARTHRAAANLNGNLLVG